MSEHLQSTVRETLIASILATADYACEWADDATLFALAAVLAQHASAVAQRLDQQRYLAPESQNMALAQLAVARAQVPNNGEPGLSGIGG